MRPSGGLVVPGADEEYAGEVAASDVAVARPLAPAAPSTAEVRRWAVAQGWEVATRGRIADEIMAAFRADREV